MPSIPDYTRVTTVNDCHCWALTRSLVEELLEYRETFGVFGWGIDVLAAVLSKEIMRDCSISVHNSPGTGYDAKPSHQPNARSWDSDRGYEVQEALLRIDWP